MGIFSRFSDNVSQYGMRWAASSAANSLLRRLGLLSELQLVKDKSVADVQRAFGDTVAYGPFKGMRLAKDVWWGRYDVASKLVGEYEPHILDILVRLGQRADCFVDIGAADGYYAVGAVKAGLYDKAVCFEISAAGQKVIAENARLNRVEDAVAIRGLADEVSLAELVVAEGRCVLLCDIEGGEFPLLDEGVLAVLKDCFIIIELHDGFVQGESGRRDALFARARMHFDIVPVERATPNVFGFPELDRINDDGRMLIFSEGRPIKMDWVCLCPKGQTMPAA